MLYLCRFFQTQATAKRTGSPELSASLSLSASSGNSSAEEGDDHNIPKLALKAYRASALYEQDMRLVEQANEAEKQREKKAKLEAEVLAYIDSSKFTKIREAEKAGHKKKLESGAKRARE